MHSSDAEAPCCDSEIVFLTDATRIHAHTRDQQPRSQWRRYARRLGAVRSAWRWVAARSRGTRACSDHTHRAIGRGNVLAIVTPIPGLTGWEGLRNQWPRWHFAFHSLPDLPEALVSGNERIYLNWFFQTLTYNKAVFSESRVERYVRRIRSHRLCTLDSSTIAPSKRMRSITKIMKAPSWRCPCRQLGARIRG